jgi:hypothetical protein
MTIFISAAVALTICCALARLIHQNRLSARDGEWQSYRPSTYKMRRWRGKWEYRDMTSEEAEKHQQNNAV